LFFDLATPEGRDIINNTKKKTQPYFYTYYL